MRLVMMKSNQLVVLTLGQLVLRLGLLMLVLRLGLMVLILGLLVLRLGLLMLVLRLGLVVLRLGLLVLVLRLGLVVGGVEIVSANVVGNMPTQVNEEGDVELNVESTEDEEAVESDYEQELDDIEADTCVDPTRDWESLQVLGIPHAQYGSRSGFDIDLGSDDLKSLDGSDGEEDEGGPPRKFIKTKYREFNPSYDMQDPIFRVGMEFADYKTFKIKSLADEHTCVISFKNKFVSSKLIAKKYVGQWRVNPDWNFTRLSQQLRTDTSVDASVWQYYRARNAARQMIQGSVNEQYSKLWEYGVDIRRMNPGSTVMIKCTEGDGNGNPRFERLYMCLAALKKGWKE
ncbi:hypothetical protein LWI29_025847 [Acer saccharum]|uniref:Uncharacterized protein n=1 Tax=Acer saccharum TaxID=4024 RepID=A0AA39THC0_ACESA|nr:hypothetical protein LWI29_025847 [Acer saccharum]